MDRGPESERTDSQCAKCGGYYMDCGLAQAQRLHDRTERCDGKLIPVMDEPSKRIGGAP